jgi:hypothetical protein
MPGSCQLDHFEAGEALFKFNQETISWRKQWDIKYVESSPDLLPN